MRAILYIVALEPLCGRGTRDIEDLGRLVVGQSCVLGLLDDLWGGMGLRMNACAHAIENSDDGLQ